MDLNVTDKVLIIFGISQTFQTDQKHNDGIHNLSAQTKKASGWRE
jgi:hypothetical protein